MKTMIFLSAIVAAILSAQPVEVSLWTDEFPQPDEVEDKWHHPVKPNGTAAIISTAGRSWELRGMALPNLASMGLLELY